MRLVLDTNVIVAAMRSPLGASAAILRSARRGQVVIVGSVALAIEYEAVCNRPEHKAAAGLTSGDVSLLLDVVIAMMEPIETHFMWRPQLRDPGDEFVLDLAVNGRVDAIVTFNGRDFEAAPAQFGISVLTPAQTLMRMKS